jgi:hypothetical protein
VADRILGASQPGELRIQDRHGLIFSNLLAGPDGPRAGGVSHSAAELARGAYVPGKYIKHLPNSYLTTTHFQVIKEMYYDIAILGHLHGTFA